MIAVNSGGATAAGAYYMRQQAEAKRQEEFRIKKENGQKLLKAAQNNDTYTVEVLLRRDTFFGCYDPSNKYFAIHYAVQNKNHKMVKMLIDKGVNPLQAVDDGVSPTPIDVAAQSDAGEIIRYLINAAYDDKTKYWRNENQYNLVKKANHVGGGTLLALMEYVLNNFKCSKDKKYFTDIDIPMLLNYVIDETIHSKDDYRRLYYRIAIFLLQQKNMHDHLAYAIVFFTLANDYKDAEKLKATTYLQVVDQAIPNDFKPSFSLSAIIDSDDKTLSHKLESVIKQLKKSASSNRLIHQELGEIFELLTKYDKAYRWFKKGANLGSQKSVIHLSHLIKYLPERKWELAKYTAMCYHLGLDGKNKDNKKAVKHLNVSVLHDPDATFHYLNKCGHGFPYVIIRNAALLDCLDFDFSIRLFEEEKSKSKPNKRINKYDMERFLTYGALHHPTNDWIRNYERAFSLVKALNKANNKSALGERLANTYLILSLLNEDSLPKSARKYIKQLAHINRQDLEAIFEQLSEFYQKDRMAHVFKVVLSYQDLVTSKKPSTYCLDSELDLKDMHQLDSLLHNSTSIKKKHKKEDIVQQESLEKLKSALDNEKDSENKKEVIEAAIKDPLFKQHNALFFNPARFFATKAVKVLKQQLKQDDLSSDNESESKNQDSHRKVV